MAFFHRTGLVPAGPLLAALAVAAALTGCTKPDQQVCTSRGYAVGTDAFNDCLDLQAKKHATIEQQQAQSSRTVQNDAAMIGSAMGGTPGLDPR